MGAHTLGRRVRSLLVQAALWAPTMGEEDAILEALQEQPDRAKVKAQVTQEKSSSCTFISWQESQREKEVPQEPRAVLPSEAEEKVPPPEVRHVLPRGSVSKENLTRRAALGPSPQVVQTASPTATRHKQQFLRRTWGQQWRSIQGAYRIELQRPQHRISQIIAQTFAAKTRRSLNVFPPALFSRLARPNQVHYAGH